jgi:hypothetical protein
MNLIQQVRQRSKLRAHRFECKVRCTVYPIPMCVLEFLIGYIESQSEAAH